MNRSAILDVYAGTGSATRAFAEAGFYMLANNADLKGAVRVE